jgi:predicted phage-related endonuclease
MEIGENEFAEYGGNVVCSWKSASRKTFDTKKFEQDHPALASKYRKETTYRTFKTTKGGK